ncbi:MAG: class I SAM-dependent methyltransferase, partial [Patescibacteria group bacterium]
MNKNIKTDNKILFKFIEEFWFAPNDALLRAIETPIWNKYSFKSKKSLAIGIGDGRYDSLIYKKHKKIDVGIDIDKKSIESAQKVPLYKNVYCESAEKMHFKDKSFDLVLSNSTIEHIENDLKAISEISRVVKKGGIFLFSIPVKRFPQYLKNIGVSKKEMRLFDKRVVHKHYKSLEEWKRVLASNGFEIQNYVYYMDQKLLKAWWILFKISTFKPYHRELWSYLKDSPYGKLAPKNLIIFLLKIYLNGKYKKSFTDQGTWVFI